MADRIYQSNQLIFQKGEPSEYAYIIRTGQVEILRDYPENPFRLAILRTGDVFGEMGLIDERPRSLAARSVGETYLSTVTRDEFIDLLQNKPDEALKYLRMFFERLRAMNRQATEANHRNQSTPTDKRFEVTIFPSSAIIEKFIPRSGFQINGQVFRVGRNSNRHEDPFEVNDLLLQDAPPYNVSRNHFSIEKMPDKVIAHDRGSFLGTIINREVIGGNHQGAIMALKEGENEIIAGSPHSPFKFRVVVKVITN